MIQFRGFGRGWVLLHNNESVREEALIFLVCGLVLPSWYKADEYVFHFNSASSTFLSAYNKRNSSGPYADIFLKGDKTAYSGFINYTLTIEVACVSLNVIIGLITILGDICCEEKHCMTAIPIFRTVYGQVTGRKKSDQLQLYVYIYPNLYNYPTCVRNSIQIRFLGGSYMWSVPHETVQRPDSEGNSGIWSNHLSILCFLHGGPSSMLLMNAGCCFCKVKHGNRVEDSDNVRTSKQNERIYGVKRKPPPPYSSIQGFPPFSPPATPKDSARPFQQTRGENASNQGIVVHGDVGKVVATNIKLL
ncbi:hypothetical protein Btru_050989 [Bulinus truncatus]|nr:hypothetical protein Btru_050989 [Bulinus truncatus]